MAKLARLYLSIWWKFLRRGNGISFLGMLGISLHMDTVPVSGMSAVKKNSVYSSMRS